MCISICCVCYKLFKHIKFIGKFNFCSEQCCYNAPQNLEDTIVEN